MILIRLRGGLGNQMFQYAFGRHLAIKNNSTLKIDTGLLHNTLYTYRNFELDIFNIPLEYASDDEIVHFIGKKYNNVIGKLYNKILWQFRKKNVIVEQDRQFHPEFLNLGDNKCLVGFWQSEKYFKDIETTIRKEFTFKHPLNPKLTDIYNQIIRTNSLCINVRRGDYVTNPIYSKTFGVLPIEYYHKGIELMKLKQNIEQIFIFSDEIAWCRENMSFIENAIMVENEYQHDLRLMSHCKHFIISNSTYSWWAAWLATNPGKTVIAPKKWFKAQSSDSPDRVPDSWIKI